MSDLKTIAIIPARGGSKGILRKNLRPLAGKPLLAYTIEQVKASGVVDACVVSTDDEEIANVARKYGAEVPFMRPPELATDAALVEPVVLHALLTYEKLTGQTFDIVVYLQPTDVFRPPSAIRDCVLRLKADPNLDSVFSAYKTHKNFWRFNATTQQFERLAPDLARYRPRQEREAKDQAIYREDAGLASATRSSFVRQGLRLGPRVDIVGTEDFRTGIDIHEPFDLWIAEKVMTEWDWERKRPIAPEGGRS